MSIVKKTYYTVICDGCGRDLCEPLGTPGTDSRDDLEILLDDADGWVTIRRRHYCPTCWARDDDDNIEILLT